MEKFPYAGEGFPSINKEVVGASTSCPNTTTQLEGSN